jgi:subtilisin-like proprotein convertase family protein
VDVPITIQGATGVIRDVDVKTLIRHDWSGDLDIEVISPSGTKVMLKAQSSEPDPNDVNAPGVVWDRNNVFNGTLFDDGATKLASTTLYQDETVEQALVPEGALGAFIGEDPNGTWNLRVTDVETGTAGTVDGWTLNIATTNPAPPLTSISNTDPGGAIPDEGALPDQTITVTGAKPYLWDVNLTTGLSHGAPGDLVVELSHGGKTVVVTQNRGGLENNLFNGTIWDDGSSGSPLPVSRATTGAPASPLVPEGAMAAFAGMDPNGDWTLKVRDTRPGDTGSLSSWKLDIQSTDGCGSTSTPPPADTSTPATTPSAASSAGVVALPPASKLTPRSLGLSVTKRDRTAPYKFNVSGKLNLPPGVAACVGKVQVTAKAGRRTVASKKVSLRKKGAACTYKAALTFKKKPKGLPSSGKLKISARFLGNTSLTARAAGAKSVKLG